MSKTHVVLAVLVILGLSYGAYTYLKKVPLTPPQAPAFEEKAFDPAPSAEYKNATYKIEGEEITLVDGKAEKEIAPGSASKLETTYFGNEARGDFNKDGQEDIAFLITQSGGGSGTFYYLVAALKTSTGYKGTNAVLLGDRIAPQTTEFRNGEIIVNYAERALGEPMTAKPSQGVSEYFIVKDGKLQESIK